MRHLFTLSYAYSLLERVILCNIIKHTILLFPILCLRVLGAGPTPLRFKMSGLYSVVVSELCSEGSAGGALVLSFAGGWLFL